MRLCFGVSCDICAGAIVLTSRLAIVSVVSVAPGRHVVAAAMVSLAVAVVPGCRAWVPSPTSLLSMYVSPSRGCDTPMNASVCNVFGGVLCLDLRNQLIAPIVIIKQTTTKRKER